METGTKCKNCGRVLKDPLSKALGMGPKCAGAASSQGTRFHIGVRRSSGQIYTPESAGGQPTFPIPSQPPARKISTKAIAHQQREERRRLFEQRLAFQCGTLVHSKTPLIYEPVGEKDWKDSLSGKVRSQDQLQTYLTRYRFI